MSVQMGHQVAMALRTAYWNMHRQADACLKPFDVTANQFVLLSLLADRDGITQQELVQRASSDPNTVSAMLAVLEEKGLIARKRHPTDGRAWSVTLSPEGRRTYELLWAESVPFRENLLDGFQPEEAETLRQLLLRISHAMGSEKHCSSQTKGGRS